MTEERKKTLIEMWPYRRSRLDDADQWPGIIFHHTQKGNHVAQLAMAILERWAMVMGKPDGYDEAGRQKLAIMPTDELVDRSIDIAEQAMAKLADRGHMFDLPDTQELFETIKENEDAKESNGEKNRKWFQFWVNSS